jgi:phage terminase large subunit-like protein
VSRNDLDVYTRAVVGRRVPAGVYHRLACVRHLRDRERARQRDRAFPFVFVPARAERFFRFAQELRHYKGEWAGRHIRLEPHQRFRLGSLFAWVHRETGLRRFRTAYNEIPRKNGKSLEAAIVSLYATFFDHEPGAEGYIIATKREQAKIVWNDAKRLCESSGLGGPARLQRRITVLAANLHRDVFAQKLEPLGADKDSTDGLNPHLIVVDEFHAHKDRGLIDVMETATGARRQPLNFQITTAGDDPMTPCGDQHDYAVQVLEGVLADETFFAFIAHADVDDDPWAEATWRKANPNYGVSVKPDDMRTLATKAAVMNAAASAFKQKRLNLWMNATTPWLSLDGWRRGQTIWTPEALAGQLCYVGIDLSAKIDLSAVVLLFPPTEARGSWRLLARCLTPAKTLEERARRDRAPYAQWVADGFLTTNPGNRIDQTVLQQWVLDAQAQYIVQQVGVDPWNAAQLVTNLMAEGLDVVEIGQNTGSLSSPAKDFEADVLDGLVDAGGNPLMQWCVSNAVVTRDNNDNIFPVKKRSRGRIDPVIAAVLARKLAATPPDDAEDPELVVA